MTYPYDLHIHSVLSPDGDVLMTPNNIFNMANIKGLKIISVTDHNTLKQIPVCLELAKSYDLLFIPGVEITVKEGFDVLCYLKNVEDVLAVDHLLEEALPKQYYDTYVYGEQWVCNIDDEFIEEYPYLLIQPLSISIKDLKNVLKPYPHILIYAHLDRHSKSGKSYIHDYPLDGVEYKYQGLKKHKTDVYNSDAHQIIDILENSNTNQIELDDLSMDAFFRYFHHD